MIFSLGARFERELDPSFFRRVSCGDFAAAGAARGTPLGSIEWIFYLNGRIGRGDAQRQTVLVFQLFDNSLAKVL